MAQELKGQQCPICGENKLILREELVEIPHFGKVFILSMECEGCNYKKADIEPEKIHDPAKYEFEVKDEKDLNVKIVRSSQATIKIPRIITIQPGPDAEGFITNVEGLLTKIKLIIESYDEEEVDRKKKKNLLKKISNVLLGRDKIKIIIDDPSGTSAIVSDKTNITKKRK